MGQQWEQLREYFHRFDLRSACSWCLPSAIFFGLTGRSESSNTLRNSIMLTLFNTLTGKQEPFEPLEPKKVRMYVCGVTVYDYCHIGHARSALIFEVLRRYLAYSGYEVTFVKNFTDVDDKIIKRANEQGIRWDTITHTYIHATTRHAQFGNRTCDEEPNATEHMRDIVAMTETLIRKGLAYPDRWRRVFPGREIPDYGLLSKRKLKTCGRGASGSPMRANDIRWISHSGTQQPDEPSWPVHGEQDVPDGTLKVPLSHQASGRDFDIHGGRMDLIFPHHKMKFAILRLPQARNSRSDWLHTVRKAHHERFPSHWQFFSRLGEIFENRNGRRFTEKFCGIFSFRLIITLRSIFPPSVARGQERWMDFMIFYALDRTGTGGRLDFMSASMKLDLKGNG